MEENPTSRPHKPRTSEADARLAAIVENSDDAIIGEDLDGVITSWNRGAARIFGYTAEEAVGHPVTILMPSEAADDMPQILDIVRGAAPARAAAKQSQSIGV